MNKYGKINGSILTLDTIADDAKARYHFFAEIETYYAKLGYALWSHNIDRRIYKLVPLVPHNPLGSLEQTQDDFLAGTGRGL